MIKTILSFIGAGVILYALWQVCFITPARLTGLEANQDRLIQSIVLVDSLGKMRYQAVSGGLRYLNLNKQDKRRKR